MNRFMKVKAFETSAESYSPLFSSIGLQICPGVNGVGRLYFNYNRASRSIFDTTIDFPFEMNCEKSNMGKIVFGNGEGKLSFYKNDAFMFESSGVEEYIIFSKISDDTPESWLSEKKPKKFIFRGYSKNRDARDPDATVGFIIGVSAKKGKIRYLKNGIKIKADENGETRLVFAFEGLECSEESVAKALGSAPACVEYGEKITTQWLEKYTSDLKIDYANEKEKDIVLTAVQGLVFNTTYGQGSLKGLLSAFPSRGGYPTHFIWDTYFQNLAYEELSPELAEDFLLQIVNQQRKDGKFPQFMCSTWARPHDTQPALFGWAAKRLYERTGSVQFIRRIFPAMELNNQWWLSQRMTRCGVIFCPSGLETGQDDSPRFDNGGTMATDMNSYLLNQIKATAEFAKILGKKKKARYWSGVAKKLNDSIVATLYDEKDNLFYDIDRTDNEAIRLVSPNAVMPLWAGIEISEERAVNMIEKYLLNENCMFGKIPFPSVAYNQPCYDARAWWRGPTWLPIAWLMLEILEKYGYNKQKKEALIRLYRMMIADEKCHELFNSETGEGMGNPQQGWSCAVFIKLCQILTVEERG